MEEAGGCYLIGNDKATGERLFGVIGQLMKDRPLMEEMGRNLEKIFVHDAASRIIGGMEHGLS